MAALGAAAVYVGPVDVRSQDTEDVTGDGTATTSVEPSPRSESSDAYSV